MLNTIYIGIEEIKEQRNLINIESDSPIGFETNNELITEKESCFWEDTTWMDDHQCFTVEGVPREKGSKEVLLNF